MNILYYLGSFPRLSKSFILNEIYELEKKGHNVIVCSIKNPGESIKHQEYEEIDIPIYYIGTPTYLDMIQLFSFKVLNLKVLKHTFYNASLKDHVINLYRAKQSIKFIENLELEIDHVHSHFATIRRFPAKYVASYFKVPFTITTHAFDLYREPVGAYTQSLLKKADSIVTISKYNKNYIQNQFTKETPINVVRAGIRPEKFTPSEINVENRILTVCRMVEKKGLTYAIEAMKEVVKKIPEVEYHIVGSGELKEELEKKVKQLNLYDNIKFLDNVDDKRLIKEFDEAECFLLPCIVAKSGDRDGIPVVLMEAMAMKTPPLSTTVSGIPELIDHEENGLLVEPRNSDEIAEALLGLLKDEEKVKDLSQKARKKIINDFNISNEVDKLESIFEEVGKSRE